MLKIVLAVLLICAMPLYAVEPQEVLSDPALESRARSLSQGLRCLVCRNESIDESHAALAKDLRVLLRERLVAGDSDAQAIDFIVARYGEYVLLKPLASGSNLILWLAGPAMLLAAMAVGTTYVRRRRHSGRKPQGLSPEEQTRLSEILND